MWINKGLIIKPQKSLWWMQTHAMLPTPEKIDEGLFKIYFSGRDKFNRSHIGYAVVEVNQDKLNLVYLSSNPVLSPGKLGHFDDSGVTPSCVLTVNDKTYLYYIGWRPRSSVRMELMPGLAVKIDENKFERVSKVPILHRNDKEPISILTAPFVLKIDSQYKMWYVSGIEWINPDLPRYDIKSAISSDAISWQQTGQTEINLWKDETALARPFVFKEKDKFCMLFSYKKLNKNYQIGFAISQDGNSWKRIDKHSYIPSASNWDNQMQAYPVLIKYQNFEFILYNGNSYGKEGIGYAVREKY